MTQKFLQELQNGGAYSFQCAVTSTTFDIYNNSTFDLSFSFGHKTSGAIDLYLPPQGAATQFKPIGLQYNTAGIKWNGLIYITASMPAGNNYPGQGVAQQLVLIAYETGYSAGNSFVMSNAAQPVNVAGQNANSMIFEGFTQSGADFSLPANGPLGYGYLLGYRITTQQATSNGNGQITISNIETKSGAVTLAEYLNYGPNMPGQLLADFPGGLPINAGGNSSSVIIQSSGYMPSGSILLFLYIF